jgi:hypothetical protein
MHMRAMRRLTTQRHTSQLSGLSDMIQMTQNWYARTHGPLNRYAKSKSRHMAPAALLCNNGEAQIEPADFGIREREGPVPSIDQVLTHCRALTVQLRQSSGGRHHAEIFSNQRSWLELQLVKRQRQRISVLSTSSPVDLQASIEDLQYITVTIYVLCYLRRYSANGPTGRRIYSQLHDGMRYITANFMPDQFTRLDWQPVLWISMVARMCAKDKPCDEDIDKLIGAAVQSLELANVTQAIASLQRFVWPVDWNASACERIIAPFLDGAEIQGH